LQISWNRRLPGVCHSLLCYHSLGLTSCKTIPSSRSTSFGRSFRSTSQEVALHLRAPITLRTVCRTWYSVVRSLQMPRCCASPYPYFGGPRQGFNNGSRWTECTWHLCSDQYSFMPCRLSYTPLADSGVVVLMDRPRSRN